MYIYVIIWFLQYLFELFYQYKRNNIKIVILMDQFFRDDSPPKKKNNKINKNYNA